MAFACDSCGKTFTARYLLKRHLVTHTRSRNHLCPVCGEAFLQSSALNRHAASHEARLAYRCEECGKRFNRSSARDVHQASHAEKKHICKQCGKTFHQKSTLKAHELIHSETKPLQCCYCEKTFRQRSNLRVHVSRWHRGVSGTLRNDDSGLIRKKGEDLLCSQKLRQDVRRENCTNSHKETKRKYCKETYPCDSEASQADIVDKNNPGNCIKQKCDLNNSNCRDEAKISDLMQSRTSLEHNNSLQTFKNSLKDFRNSTTVAAENKLRSDSDVEEAAFETEEYSSLIHFMSHVQKAARFKFYNSEVFLNAEEESHSDHPSGLAPSSVQCCKDINEKYGAFPNSEASCQPRDARTRPTENSAAAPKLARGVRSTSGNQSKVEITSETATTKILNYSVPAQQHPLPIRPLASVELTDTARNTEKIPSISDRLPISLSVLPQSSINVYTNRSSVNESVLKQDEQSVLPSVENFLTNVYKSCRLATSLMSPLVTIEQSATISCKQKVAPRCRSLDFSCSKMPSDKHLRVKRSTRKKSEKVMYVKLFTPEKPVTEFIWSCFK